MLFARQRDLPFAQATRSTGMPDVVTATRLRRPGGPMQGAVVLDSRPRHSRVAVPPARVAAVSVADAEGIVAGASFARKRIEHATELFGACMFIALALAMALFA